MALFVPFDLAVILQNKPPKHSSSPLDVTLMHSAEVLAHVILEDACESSNREWRMFGAFNTCN